VQVGGFSPFPIAYESLCPKKVECENLLVPVCLSATHISYGSIRMEPVFMVLGQSAATAACLAIDDKVPVQDVTYAKLQKRLLADGQVLKWTGPQRTPPVDPKSLPGIVLDDGDAKLTGTWLRSRSVPGYVGQHYLHDNNADKPNKSAVFKTTIPKAGKYDVRISWTPNPNRASKVVVSVVHAKGVRVLFVNQKKKPNLGIFQSLGVYEFAAGKIGAVMITNGGTDGHVIVDAVQFLPETAAKSGKK
jgi:hypothetical protein